MKNIKVKCPKCGAVCYAVDNKPDTLVYCMQCGASTLVRNV